MALVSVASSLPSAISLRDGDMIYIVAGQRGEPADLHGWGISEVDDAVLNAWAAAHPEQSAFVKVVTQADVDAMIAEQTDPAGFGHESALAVLPPSAARLDGGRIADPAGLQSVLRTISDAGFAITINGVAYQIVADLSGSSSLSMVAARISAALDAAGADALCAYTFTSGSGSFVLASNGSGATQTISYASAPASGSDISGLCALTAGTGATVVPGSDGDTAA